MLTEFKSVELQAKQMLQHPPSILEQHLYFFQPQHPRTSKQPPPELWEWLTVLLQLDKKLLILRDSDKCVKGKALVSAKLADMEGSNGWERYEAESE